MHYAHKEVAQMVQFPVMPWNEYGNCMFTTSIITQKTVLELHLRKKIFKTCECNINDLRENTTLMKVASVLCKLLNNTKVLMRHGAGCMNNILC
jgi:hypothetical protein